MSKKVKNKVPAYRGTVSTWANSITLYKYMSCEAFEATIKTWSLKACLPYEANDIMELTPQAVSEKSLYINTPNTPQKSPPPFLCFSRKITTPAMWGHYADSGKGVCLVFCFPVTKSPWKHDEKATGTLEFSSAISKKLENQTKKKREYSFLAAVTYKEERETAAENIIGKPLTDVTDWFCRLISTKGKSWEYEDEVRLISDYQYADKTENGRVLFSWPMNYLLGVVTGPNCKYAPAVAKEMLKTAYNSTPKKNVYLEALNNVFPGFIGTRASFHWKRFEIEAAPWLDRLYGMKTLVAYAAFLQRLKKAPLPTIDAKTKEKTMDDYSGSWNDKSKEIFETNGNDVVIFSTITEEILRNVCLLSDYI